MRRRTVSIKENIDANEEKDTKKSASDNKTELEISSQNTLSNLLF